MSDSGFTLTDPPVPPPPEPLGQPPAPLPGPGRLFSEEDINRARTEEREKLYSEREKDRAELARLSAESAERERQAEQAQAAVDAAAEAERRRKDAEELDAKSLIEKRDQEWEQRIAQMDEHFRSELATRDALLAKEREYSELSSYIAQAVAANADNILPELVDFVGGNNVAEVDASLARVVERSASVLENFRQAGAVARQAAPGISPRAPAIGPDSMVAGQRTFSPEDIANWSMADYQQYRDQLPPGKAGRSDRGMF